MHDPENNQDKNNNPTGDITGKPEIDQNIDDNTKHLITHYYTRGDDEKAAEMFNGMYHDIYVIKVKFGSPDGYGAFILFLNQVYFELVDSFGILTSAFEADDIRVDVPWLEFEEMISKAFEYDGSNELHILDMLQLIKDTFTTQVAGEVINFIRIEDKEALGYLFNRDVVKKMGLIKSRVYVEFEIISSLDMELHSKQSVKLTPEQLEKGYCDEETETEEHEEQESFEAPDIMEEIKESIGEVIGATVKEELQDDIYDAIDGFDAKYVKYILNGAFVLSPIKGINIAGLVVKDKIKVRISDDNPMAIRIARAFNAYQDGKMKPIVGKIVSYRHKPKGGYKIFVEVAEGIVLRVDEDEDNIKVDFVEPSPDRPPELQKDIEKYVDRIVSGEKARPISKAIKTAENTEKIEKRDKLFLAIILIVVFTLVSVAVRYLLF